MAAFDEPIDAGLPVESGRNERGVNLRGAARPPAETDDATGPDLGIVPSDRFGRLRAELAQLVAEAELARVRAECDKWRAIAEERDRALDRADLTLQTLVNALQLGQSAPAPPAQAAAPSPAPAAPAPPAPAEREAEAESQVAAPAPRPERAPAPEPPFAPAPVDPLLVDPLPADVVPIPPYVRDEARRYAETLAAMHEYRTAKEKQYWWQFWR